MHTKYVCCYIFRLEITISYNTTASLLYWLNFHSFLPQSRSKFYNISTRVTSRFVTPAFTIVLACGRHTVAESRHSTVVNVANKERQWGWDIEENKMEGKEKPTKFDLCQRQVTSDFGFGFLFFSFNFNFEMLPVVPGGGLRLRAHWWQGMGVGSFRSVILAEM